MRKTVRGVGVLDPSVAAERVWTIAHTTTDVRGHTSHRATSDTDHCAYTNSGTTAHPPLHTIDLGGGRWIATHSFEEENQNAQLHACRRSGRSSRV